MERARAIDAFVGWTLRIVLSAVFLLAGLPKLLGIETMGLQAAAMRGFPTWIRLLAGTVEVAGAIGLLIPGVATVAALLLACVMVPATITQIMSGEPGVWVPLVLLGLLLFVAWWENSKVVRDGWRDYAGAPHPLLRDGVIAGLIGASAIAVWVFIIDLVAGRPFFTPATLGRGLVAVLGHGPPGDSVVAFVLAYTVFHFAAFMLVGLVASLVVSLARREPSILFGFLILFVATEVGIYALVALLDVATPLGRYAWLQIMAGNLIAAALMGTYFWRTHGELYEEFRHSLDDETSAAGEARLGGLPTEPGAAAVRDRG